MRAQVRLSPFLRQILGTALTSVLTIVCLAVMTRALAKGLGPDGFGAVSLVRRIVATIEPLVTLGATISISRYVAFTQGPADALNYARAGFLLVLAATGLFAGVAWVASEPLTVLVFGDAAYHSLFLAMLALVTCYSIYISLYALYRGQGNMLMANAWQMAVIALGPMLIAIFCRNAVTVTALMSLLLGAAALPLLRRLRPFRVSRADRDSIRPKVEQMFRYGWGRMPGGLLFGGILTLGPLLAPHVTSLRDTGYLIVGQSILKIVEGGFEAFGRVALPAMAAIHGSEGKLALRGKVADLLGLIADVGIFSTIHALIWIELLVVLWLGPEYRDASSLVRIMALSLMPYLAFVTLRSVFDAIEEKAVTTGYLAAAFALSLAVSGALILVGHGATGLAIGPTVGFALLGTLVIRRLGSDLQLDLRKSFRLPALLINLVLGILTLLLRDLVVGVFPSGLAAQAGFAFAIEAGMFLLFLGLLHRNRADWVIAIRKRVFVEA